MELPSLLCSLISDMTKYFCLYLKPSLMAL